MRLILIKYGELTTKKDNRGFFINTLKRNIEYVLKGIDYEIKSDYARMFIETDEIEEAIERLKKVYGIHEMTIAYKLSSNDIEVIKNETIDILKEKDFKTFKVETKRSDKDYSIPSMEISRMVGAHILKNIPGKSVDVHNPDYLITLEVRHEGTFLYFEYIEGAHGYPVGTLGKGLMMLSGGIDSPVAAYLALKRGISLNYLYFESFPHTSIEARNKVIKLASIVSAYGGHSNLYVVNFTPIQEAIYKYVPEEYNITILRRMMYRIAERICKRQGCLAIVNGESVGQVASQTLTSMGVINEVVKIPVLRPVCAFDKLEIIDIAKKIDTYDTSILPYEDCCTIFLPKRPVINPKSYLCEEYESTFDFEPMIEEAVKSLMKIEITTVKEKVQNEYL